jgi:hypothetical protein
MTEDNPWVSVDDEMPENGEYVLVWYKQDQCEPNAAFVDRWHENDWRESFSSKVTHWQRIVGPKKPTSPLMVEAPCEKNMYTCGNDPKNFVMDETFKTDIPIIWWNNRKDHRLWYWHNDQWNRAI